MNPYPHNDKIKAVLKDNADFVQKDGLNYLIPAWQRFANEYADTESSLDEWLNHLDTRMIIENILNVLPQNERVKVEEVLKYIDDQAREKTFMVNECVWGQEVEQREHYNRQKHWYYYRVNEQVFKNTSGRFTKFAQVRLRVLAR